MLTVCRITRYLLSAQSACHAAHVSKDFSLTLRNNHASKYIVHFYNIRHNQRNLHIRRPMRYVSVYILSAQPVANAVSHTRNRPVFPKASVVADPALWKQTLQYLLHVPVKNHTYPVFAGLYQSNITPAVFAATTADFRMSVPDL